MEWQYIALKILCMFQAIQCHSRLPACLVNAEQIRQHLIKATFARAPTNSHAQALQVH